MSQHTSHPCRTENRAEVPATVPRRGGRGRRWVTGGLAVVLAVVFGAAALTSEASQELEWAIRQGGTLEDRCEDLVVDPAGNLYATGGFHGTVDFDPGSGVAELTSHGAYDAFVERLDADGELVWAVRIGGLGGSTAWALQIALDDAGSSYVLGYFRGTVDFDPGPGTFELSGEGGFVVKLDPTGAFAWAAGIGHEASTLYVRSLAVDGAGNVFVAGEFWETIDLDPGPGTFLVSNPTTSEDSFLLKLDPQGLFEWGGVIGGPNWYDYVFSLSADAAGNLYAAGLFGDTADFDPGPGVYELTSPGGDEGFLLKLAGDGTMLWAHGVGGEFSSANAVTVDDDGHLYSCGACPTCADGPVDFDPGPGVYEVGGGDTFILKLDPAGGVEWAVSSSVHCADGALAVAGDHALYDAGTFHGSGNFATNGGWYTLSTVGPVNSFIRKLDPTGTLVWVAHFVTPGTPSSTMARVVTLGPAGTLYTAGSFAGTMDADPGPGEVELESAGERDIVLVKLTPDQPGAVFADGVETEDVTAWSFSLP